MCGIVGLAGPQDDAWIEAMNAAQAHRGPDGGGVYRDRDAGLSLAMRRLAIIDIAGGEQPMSTADGRFTIVFNGEIYNAPELRRALEADGVAFATDHSDTEVVLRLFAREGRAMLDRLNGMFAFVVYDRDRRVLFGARDRIGIKPFYYLDIGGRFAFASEMKALLALPFVTPEVDPEGLYHYVSLMYVPGPRSILAGIERLAPGHALTYRLDDRALMVERWWRLDLAPARMPARDWPDAVRAGLEAACARWTLADVPIGCLLSGGLDSSAIAGLLAKTGSAPGTYSLGFTGAGEARWNELDLAREGARRWGTDHHEIVLDAEALLDELPAMVWHMDEPYGGGLPSWSVFAFLGRERKVALTGTGGDELFGNYFKFVGVEGNAVRRIVGGTTASYERFRDAFFARHYYAGDGEKRAAILRDGFPPTEDTGRLLYRRFAADEAAGVRDRAVRTDFETQLPDEFLAMTDRFSMAHGVEARTPFLDHEFVEAVMRIPAGVRLHRRTYKKLLRDAVADLLPPALLAAPKRGFVIPLTLWLRGRLRPLVERLLAPERLAAQGYFRAAFHDRYVASHLAGRADHTTLVWGALMFQLWHIVFIEERAGARPGWDVRSLAA